MTFLQPWRVDHGPPAPQIFATAPTAQEIIAAINANTTKVQTYQASSASLSFPGVPSLSAKIALEPPRRVRVQAGTQLLGQEVDLGSNEELFWFWARRSSQQNVFFARHDELAASGGRVNTPVDLEWLLSALGLVTIDPTSQVQSLTSGSDGNYILTLQEQSPTGPQTRQLVVDASRGWVLQQQLYGIDGSLEASAVATSHRYYPSIGVSLPQSVSITLPKADLSFTIDVGTVLLNFGTGDPSALYSIPEVQGAPPINLLQMPNPALR